MIWAATKGEIKQTISRTLIMLAVSFAIGLLTHMLKFNNQQVISCSVFIMVIMATLLFWEYRLPIAFLGIGVLVGTNVLTLPIFIRECKLDVILFLVGMMITVGVLRDLGLFTWIIQSVLAIRGITGPRFIVITIFLAAFLACTIDEVTSIVFIATLIFQVCDTLKVRPLPFIIIAVLGTNIGSSGTMLGNPVGILIGQNATPPLSFIDFMTWSFPIMLITLTTSMVVLLWWYRKEINLLSERLSARREMDLGLGPLVNVPYKRGLAIFAGMIFFIALHRYLERGLGLGPNTILIVAPLVIAGLLMLWRHQRSRHYIESNVDWWTLLFFMMLFAKAGTLQETHVTEKIAEYFQQAFGNRLSVLTPAVIGISALGSAFVDNIVFAAAFMPVVNKLQQTPLLWALLQGTCLGGNITMIGSTANIVALGMLEKRYRTHVYFFEWLKIGAIVGIVSCVIAWAGITVLSPYMPTTQQRLDEAALRMKTYPAAHNIVEPNKP